MMQAFEGGGHQITQSGHIINFPAISPPESQLQADFAKRTGIWCPREARVSIELLLTDHAFTAKELAHAWRLRQLTWSRESARLFVKTPVLDALAGWALSAWSTVAFSLSTVQFMTSSVPPTVATTSWYVVLAVSYIVAMTIAAYFFLRPRAIALRVRRAMAVADDQHHNVTVRG